MSILKIVPLSQAGGALKEIRRESKGFTNQQELADKMKIHPITLRKLESDGNFTKDQLLDYCKFLGVGEPYLVIAMNEDDVRRLLNAMP